MATTTTTNSEKKQRGRKAGSKNIGPKKIPQRGMGVAQLEELRKRELWWPRAAVDGSGDPVLLGPDRSFPVVSPSFHEPLAGAPVRFPVQHHPVGPGPNSPDLLAQYLWALHHRAGSGPHPRPRIGDGFGLGDSSSSSSGGGGGGPEMIPYGPSPSTHRNGVYKKKRTEKYGLPEKAPVTGCCHCTAPNEFGLASDHMAVHRTILESSILQVGRKICQEHQFFPQRINGYNFIDCESPDAHHTSAHDGSGIDLSLRL